MKGAISFFLSLLLLISCGDLLGQTKKELEQRKKKLQKEINETNAQLKATQKNKKNTVAQVEALTKKIRLRQELISTITKEVNGLDREIKTTSDEIQSMEKQMKQLKSEYAEMIRFAQINQSSYQRLMYIFASEDFNQAYKRLKYLQQYSDYRKRQAALIDSTQKQLTVKKLTLETSKNEKAKLRETELKQKSVLEQDKQEQNRMLAKLSDREKKLRNQLIAKQKAKRKLDKAIDDLIRKEIEAAKRKAEKAGNKNVTSSNVFSLTPEAKKLSAGFSGNKGKLPWPVEKGRISSRFGEHPHPELKGIVVKNNGIDIRSTPGSYARSIFEGEVTGVINIPGSNSAVIIRHGEYLTVYSNLASVTVKKGDKVTTKQNIGKVYTDADENVTELHLEIWKGTAKLDPAPWLSGN